MEDEYKLVNVNGKIGISVKTKEFGDIILLNKSDFPTPRLFNTTEEAITFIKENYNK